MATARNKRTSRSAAALSAPGRYSDGGSLYLTNDGQGEAMRRRWLFLFNWNGKRREMGLGSAAVINRSKGELATSLAKARQARDVAEKRLREGRDPIAARDRAREERASKPTFDEIADALVANLSRRFDKRRPGRPVDRSGLLQKGPLTVAKRLANGRLRRHQSSDDHINN